MAGPKFSVGIFEGATGSLVWQRYDGLVFYCWKHSVCVGDTTRSPLRTLENAVLAALVDSAEASPK